MTEVATIITEGKQAGTLRNVARLWIEVESASVNTMVEGRLVPESGVGRIEIYADRLEAVLAMVRTEDDHAVYAQARKIAAKKLSDWRQKHAKAIAEAPNPEHYVRINSPYAPEIELAAMGYERGMPPLLSCKVVNPKNPKQTIEAEAYLKLPAEKRAEFLLDPPLTPANAQQVAMEKLAATLGQSQSELIQALVEALGKKAGK